MNRMRNIIGITLFFMFLGLVSSAQTLKQVNILIAQDSINELESHPFTNEDVHGDFVIGTDTFDYIELHYRGAYYLWSLIQQGDLRNWKVKFPKSNRFENRREWNFNYEDYIRQNLAYHVFRQANVPVVSSENVILHVNGQRKGLYLKYEDPDDKKWLTHTFGDNDGDLYKAAYDMPGQTKYFADLTYLGDNDSDYFLHYRKQTNKDGADEFDYSSIRDFTALINHTPDDEFEQVILENFAVEEFIEYLVVANFISNWDSYPYRPKNFFLYDNPEDGKWHFIPWDLDGTFQDGGHRNPIGVTGSIFHYFDGIDNYNQTAGEPLDRPLVWRLMAIPKFRDKYCYEYQKAVDTYLSKGYLYQVIDSIALTVTNNTSGNELFLYNADVSKTKNFIYDRLQNVESQLSGCVIEKDPFLATEPIEPTDTVFQNIKIYPNPATDIITVELPNIVTGNIDFQLINVLGQTLRKPTVHPISTNVFTLNTSHIPRGQYILMITTDVETLSMKLFIDN